MRALGILGWACVVLSLAGCGGTTETVTGDLGTGGLGEGGLGPDSGGTGSETGGAESGGSGSGGAATGGVGAGGLTTGGTSTGATGGVIGTGGVSTGGTSSGGAGTGGDPGTGGVGTGGTSTGGAGTGGSGTGGTGGQGPEQNCVDAEDDDFDGEADCSDTDCAGACANACSSQIELSDPSYVTGSTVGHGDLYASSCADDSGAEVAYSFTAAQSGLLQISLDSPADLGVAVFASCVSSELACADNYFGGFTEYLEVSVTMGTTYTILVDGYASGEESDFSLTVETVPVGDVCEWLDCDDFNACTVDSCVSGLGCENDPITQPHSVCSPGSPMVDAPGCFEGDAWIVSEVCAVDSFCCTNSWDGVCVNEVLSVAGSNQCQPDTCSHSVCSSGTKLVDGCNSCTTLVCDDDPYCCSTSWDNICVSEATDLCGLCL